MIALAMLGAHSAYNTWMNGKLYGVCATMPDALRKEQRGAAFGSVHGTLNHLLLADKLWLGRFNGAPFAVTSLGQELYSDFEELRAARVSTDDAIAKWVAGLTEAQLAAPFTYTSTKAELRTYPLWLVAQHLFNHQTHHRGQLTTLLEQCGYDSGVTDLLLLPRG